MCAAYCLFFLWWSCADSLNAATAAWCCPSDCPPYASSDLFCRLQNHCWHHSGHCLQIVLYVIHWTACGFYFVENMLGFNEEYMVGADELFFTSLSFKDRWACSIVPGSSPGHFSGTSTFCFWWVSQWGALHPSLSNICRETCLLLLQDAQESLNVSMIIMWRRTLCMLTLAAPIDNNNIN